MRTYQDCGMYQHDLKYEYVKVSSYSGTKQGEVRFEGGWDLSKAKGEHILLVEDLIESGRTLTKTKNALIKAGAKSVKILCGLDKYTCRAELAKDLVIDFCGFKIENWWIVGYGVDYNDCFRGLKHIYSLNDLAKKEFAIEKK